MADMDTHRKRRKADIIEDLTFRVRKVEVISIQSQFKSNNYWHSHVYYKEGKNNEK